MFDEYNGFNRMHKCRDYESRALIRSKNVVFLMAQKILIMCRNLDFYEAKTVMMSKSVII